MSSLGWIGLGRIGLPMVSRLISANHEVFVWDVASAAMEAAAKFGAKAASSPADIAARAGIYFLCVPDAAAVEQVVFGADGISTACPADAIVVDHTTIDPDICRDLAARAASQCGLGWIDVPVSGGPGAANDGNLIAWAGGTEADFSAVQPLVSAYAPKLSYMGAVGQGQLAKSCNQMIVGSTIAVWSEMLRYAESFGLDPLTLIETLEGGAADSPVSRYFARALAQNAMPKESIRNMTKDLGVVTRQATGKGLRPTIAQAALDEFDKAIRS